MAERLTNGAVPGPDPQTIAAARAAAVDRAMGGPDMTVDPHPHPHPHDAGPPDRPWNPSPLREQLDEQHRAYATYTGHVMTTVHCPGCGRSGTFYGRDDDPGYKDPHPARPAGVGRGQLNSRAMCEDVTSRAHRPECAPLPGRRGRRAARPVPDTGDVTARHSGRVRRRQRQPRRAGAAMAAIGQHSHTASATGPPAKATRTVTPRVWGVTPIRGLPRGGG